MPEDRQQILLQGISQLGAPSGAGVPAGSRQLGLLRGNGRIEWFILELPRMLND